MRATLLACLLLGILAVGVVQTRRSGDPGALVSTLAAPAASREDAAESPPPAAPASAAARPAAPPPAERPVLAAGELSVVEPEATPMVRYLDAEGSVHMVRGLERVPPEHRAGAVVLRSGNVNVVSMPAPSSLAFHDWQPEANPNHSDVVLFSASWCGACQRARRHLDRRGVRYEERDIDADGSARQEVESILGRVAIPLLDVDGRYISGFRPDVYDRALGSG